MQSQPLVKSSPNHHRNHHKQQQQQQQLGPHRHSNLPSLNRFRSAVRNVAHSLNHFHHHSVADSVSKSADPAASMSGNQQQQMGRLRKLAGAGLLSRFRSGSKATSDDDEAPSARSGAHHVGAGSVKPTSPCGGALEPDPLTATAVDGPSTGVSSHWLSGGEQGNNGGVGQQTSDKPEKLINGDGTDERTLPTTDDHSSPDGVRQHPDERKKKEQEQPKSVVAYGDVESVATGRWESADEASAASPTTGPPPSSPPPGDDSDTDGVRVYKKVSTNGKLVLYLINRDLVIAKGTVSPLHAVVTVDADELRNRKIFAQILLTFRYGRDDEEVMGLKLSNESVLCVEQVYPLLPGVPAPQPLTKCQEVLMKRLGPQAHLINLKLNHTVPASVRLLPAKEYRGAAIGINYDLRVYTAESIEEKPHRRSQVRMAIRLVQYAPLDIQQTEAPQLRLEKHFLLREGALQVEAGLDRQWYTQGSPINVCLRIHNRSSRIVKKIQIRAIQHVDVTMFSNGKFKNTIAVSEETDGLPLTTGNTLDRQYGLALMENGGGRHWVALEDRYGRLTATLASTTLKSAPNERHFFAIYISYYVKVRLVVSGVGGDVSVKIPFVLMRDGPETSPVTLDAGDDTYQSSRSPERQLSPVLAVTQAADIDPAADTEKHEDGGPESGDTPTVEHEVDAELHPEPKLFISGGYNPLNGDEEATTHSSSSPDEVKPDDKV